MILTLWEDFLQYEAPYLTANVHNTPVILGMRLLVNTFHGISVGTGFNSVILFDVPIPEVEQLQSWLQSNNEYVEVIVSQKIYEKQHQIIQRPLPSQIRTSSQIMSLTEMVKSFWIKAKIQVTKLDQRFYVLAWPNCSKPCGATYGDEFKCFYCGNDFPSLKVAF